MLINDNYHQFMKIIKDFFIENNNIDNFDKNNYIYYYHIVCKKCNKIPQIIFIGFNKINLECDCSHFINIDNTKFISENYLIKLNKNLNEKINKIFLCEKHSLKYYAYCDECSKDLCEQCFYEEEKMHLTHTKLFFPNVYERCKKIVEFYANRKKESIHRAKCTINFLNSILYNYKEYPCYTNYYNLFNLIHFLVKNENERELYQLSHEEDKKMENYIKIRNIREIKGIKNDNPDKINFIESIKINKQNFYDLNILKINNPKINYTNLITLDLIQNNISDIKHIINIYFPNLINLDLSKNRLSDENIDTINNLYINCPKLLKFNLSDNAFTKYEIFKCYKNYESLQNLSIFGNNIIFHDYKNNKNKNLIYEFPPNFEELDVSFGVFSNQSINIIKYFALNNLKKLYLCSNNLTSLFFVENMNCINLEEFWLSNNQLKEFYDLKKFKKLKVIGLKGNKICNINNLVDFVQEFSNIEKIILSENIIDVDNSDNDMIIEKAKKHRNALNEKIQLFF